MANTINSYTGNNAASVATNRSQQSSSAGKASAGSTSSAPAASEGGSQEVQLSSTASQLASLGAKLSAQPAVNQAKVAQISKALADGTYQVSADKIASGLMQSEQTLAQIGID